MKTSSQNPIMVIQGNHNLTRIRTLKKAKLKESDDQTNINKYKVAANIKKYNIISKLIFRRSIIPKCYAFYILPNLLDNYNMHKLMI